MLTAAATLEREASRYRETPVLTARAVCLCVCVCPLQDEELWENELETATKGEL